MSLQGVEHLSEREKAVLRLLLRGYDVKAIAASLDLSPHTVNERLRHARRKLGVGSSREAARLLDRTESVDPKLFGAIKIGIELPSALETEPSLLDEQAAESNGDVSSVIRGRPIRFGPFPDLPRTGPSLPLRPDGDAGNTLNKWERLVAIVDLTTKLAAALAIVCVIALLVNSCSVMT